MTETLSGSQARRIALAAQGFARPRPQRAGTRQLNLAMARMGTVQIDSVNVFARSHYMPFFSRLGGYDPALLDRLTLSRRGPYTEYWAHVATFVPIGDWALWRFRMDEQRARHLSDPDGWARVNRATMEWVRAELAARGPLRPAEIEHDARRGRRGPWWDWDVVKRALELLWRWGEVAIAGRQGFERRYALAEHVIPAETLAREVPRGEAIRELVDRAARSYGVATAADIADYYRVADRPAVTRAIGELVDAGRLAPVRVSGWERGDRPIPAWRHTDSVLPRRLERTALLTPFDPVVWFRQRAERMFDFHYRIEIYTPPPQRVYGYYSLPVLVGERIAARVDLKADRAASVLRVQSAWWERDAPVGSAERIAAELREAATWQGLERISVSDWGDAVDDLARVMPGASRHESRPAQSSAGVAVADVAAVEAAEAGEAAS